MTLFNLREKMRANLFVFRAASDPWIRRFVREPERMLELAFPKLRRVIGGYGVSSRVESGCVDLYVLDGEPPPGVAVIGDAFQSACPSTGLGLTKILTDIDVLSEVVPTWFAAPGLSPEKMARYYRHPRKLFMDQHALLGACPSNTFWATSEGQEVATSIV
jgi:2-polyprenyl-6-methoxyphenol hydroxylase-like FAD-dependent oxidoreductase